MENLQSICSRLAMRACHGFAPTARLAFFALILLRVVTGVSLQGIAQIDAARPASLVAWGSPFPPLFETPRGVSGVAAIALGTWHGLLLDNRGEILAWGEPGRTNLPAAVHGVVAISAYGERNLALTDGGRVIGWGAPVFEAYPPSDLGDVVDVAQGPRHGLALRKDGTVAIWGGTSFAPVSLPPGLSNVVAVAAGEDHSLALHADGSITTWGSYTLPEHRSDLGDLVAIAAASHSVALRADGTVVVWAGDSRVTTIPAGLSNVVAVAAGYLTTVALRADGTLVTWGEGKPGQTGTPVGLQGVTLVAATQDHRLAAMGGTIPIAPRLGPRRVGLAGDQVFFHPKLATGPSVAWQWRRDGIALPGQTNGWLHLRGLTLADAGEYALMASNSFGVAISSGASLEILLFRITALPGAQEVNTGETASFKVEVEGHDLSYQWLREGAEMTGATNATLSITNVQVANFGHYSVRVSNPSGSFVTPPARLAANPVIEWGTLPMPSGPSGPYFLPRPTSLAEVVNVAIGPATSLAVHADGRVTVWGSMNYRDSLVVAGLSNVVAVSTGYAENLALLTNGTVVSWGAEIYGGSRVPPGLSNVVALVTGLSQSLGLRADGTVTAWGGSLFVPAGLSNVVAVATGSSHCLALLNDGTVQGWGDNRYDQTTIPTGLDHVIAIAAGGQASFALRADGTVVAWGSNDNDLGIIPPVVNTVGVQELAAGSGHSVALLKDASIVVWGASKQGQTNFPGAFGPVEGVAAGFNRSLALTKGGAPIFRQASYPSRVSVTGTAAFFRAPTSGERPVSYQWRHQGRDLPGQTNDWLQLDVQAPAEAGDYTLLASNRWGRAVSAPMRLDVIPLQLLASPSSQRTYPGGSPTLTVSVQGARLSYQWQHNGQDIPGATNPVIKLPSVDWGDGGAYLARVTSAFGAVTSAVATLVVEPLVAWGRGPAGQNSPPPGLSNLVALASGDAHTLVLGTDGLVRAWGANDRGQINVPASLSNVVSIAAGGSSSFAVQKDGTLVAWGSNDFGQTNLAAGLANIVAVSAGPFHVLALRADGTVVAWGNNEFGQATIPARLGDVVDVAAGHFHSAVVKGDGTILVWGKNAAGQAVPPDGLRDVVAVSAGAAHTLALRGDGTLTAWGDNHYHQCEVPLGLLQVTRIYSGPLHNLALNRDGTLAGWGSDFYGQTGPPPGLVNTRLLATGAAQSTAMWADGAPWISPPTRPRRVVLLGSQVLLHSSAAGVAPIVYQWWRNGVRLAGETKPVLTLRDFRSDATGAYTLSASNRLGMAMSAEIKLDLDLEPMSPPRLSLERAGSGLFRLSILGGADGVYQILTSRDLFVWEMAGNLTNRNGLGSFSDFTNYSRQFYRLQSP